MLSTTMGRRVGQRTLTAMVAVMVLALSLLVASASAHEESEAEQGPLEVEARPSIVPVDGRLFLDAEYEIDGEDDDEDGDDDSDHEDDEGDDEDERTLVAVPQSVTFTVDWGDGSQAERMTITEQERDDDEFEAEAAASHPYGTAGTYAVTVTATPDVGDPVTVSLLIHVGTGSARVAGDDRLGTAVDISRDSFPEDGTAAAVLLARADHYADALAAASLALIEDAPVLLTHTGSLPVDVLDEIDRAMVDGGTVYLLGGEQALSADVATGLEQRGHPVVRVAGDDRIATALELARFLAAAGVEIDEVVVASAANFPDALAAAAFAASVEAPVLLTGPEALDGRVADFLTAHDSIEEVLVAGGTAAVSSTVEEQLVALGLEVERFAGDDRYETAVEIAERLFPDATTVLIATGASFADALAGAAQAGRLDAPVLLVADHLPDDVRDYLEDRAGTITAVYTLGGPAAVPQTVADEVNTILGLD